MSLVSYETSDSDDGGADDNVQSNPLKYCDKLCLSPKKYLDSFKHKSSKVTPTKKTVNNYANDTNEPAQKIIKSIMKPRNTFSILSTAKYATLNKAVTFDPKVIRSDTFVPKAVKAKMSAIGKKPELPTERKHFFSSIFTDIKVPQQNISNILKLQVDSARAVQCISNEPDQNFVDLTPNENGVKLTEHSEITTEKAIEKLCGKKHRPKTNQIKFIEIHIDQIMDDSREWRSKALTDEKPSTSLKKGEEPSYQSRRKHQITYLAYQAKQNEQELKKQWATNRISRKQAQAKYGF